MPLRADWAKSAADWTLDLSELEAALSERTKLLVLNTPHNPTGKVFSAAELEGIAHIVRKYPRLVVMSDEVYEFMTFDGLPHARISALPGMFDRTLSIHSAGKTFSATGWRIGYVIGPAPLITPLDFQKGWDAMRRAETQPRSRRDIVGRDAARREPRSRPR